MRLRELRRPLDDCTAEADESLDRVSDDPPRRAKVLPLFTCWLDRASDPPDRLVAAIVRSDSPPEVRERIERPDQVEPLLLLNEPPACAVEGALR